jgi:hypothetical protein
MINEFIRSSTKMGSIAMIFILLFTTILAGVHNLYKEIQGRM